MASDLEVEGKDKEISLGQSISNRGKDRSGASFSVSYILLDKKREIGTWRNVLLHVSGWLKVIVEQLKLLCLCHFVFAHLEVNCVFLSLHSHIFERHWAHYFFHIT